jgi:hypothetical protein
MIVITARLINTAMLAEGPRLGNRKAPAHPRPGREAMADGIIGGVALAPTENALIAAPAGQSVKIGILPSRRRHALARKNPSRHGGEVLRHHRTHGRLLRKASQ